MLNWRKIQFRSNVKDFSSPFSIDKYIITSVVNNNTKENTSSFVVVTEMSHFFYYFMKSKSSFIRCYQNNVNLRRVPVPFRIGRFPAGNIGDTFSNGAPKMFRKF